MAQTGKKSGRQQLRVLLAVVGFFTVAGILGFLLWIEHREAIRAAETNGRNLAAVMEARLDATLRRTDAVLHDLQRQLPVAALRRSGGDGRNWDAELDARSQHFPELAGLRVFDAAGGAAVCQQACRIQGRGICP